MHVDWAVPANSTFGPITNIPVAAFAAACSGGGACIPQLSSRQKLDSLADRLMYRLAYRNFGDHETLVVNHSVTAGTSVGVRWYELRNPGGTPVVYQQSTYAPDATYRWMGSAAMDANGNLAVGYSASSASIFPGIRYTGRLASDPLNTLQAESVLVSGTGSQQRSLSRWGDYSSLTIDPSDDCTFWFTSEYLTTNGTFNWHTRIGSFKFPTCSSAPPPPGDFSIGVSPSSQIIGPGPSSAAYTVATQNTGGGAAGTVELTVSGLPAGVTGAFVPTSVTAGSTSTLTLTSDGTITTGTFTVTGTNRGVTPAIAHSATAGLTVRGAQPVTNGGFETGDLSGWAASGLVLPVAVTGGHSGGFAAKLGSTSPFNGDSTLAQTIAVPASGGTLTFWYNPHCPDTLTYDQQQAQLRSTTGATLTTILNVCSNSGVWTQKTFSLAAYANQSVVLWFNVHDDGYPTDPTYMLVDDISVQ